MSGAQVCAVNRDHDATHHEWNWLYSDISANARMNLKKNDYSMRANPNGMRHILYNRRWLVALKTVSG